MKHIRSLSKIPQRADDTTVADMVLTALVGVLDALATFFDGKEATI